MRLLKNIAEVCTPFEFVTDDQDTDILLLLSNILDWPKVTSSGAQPDRLSFQSGWMAIIGVCGLIVSDNGADDIVFDLRFGHLDTS